MGTMNGRSKIINVGDDSDEELSIFFSTSTKGTNKDTVNSVKKYYNDVIERRDTQLAIMASMQTLSSNFTNFIDLSQELESHADFEPNTIRKNVISIHELESSADFESNTFRKNKDVFSFHELESEPDFELNTVRKNKDVISIHEAELNTVRKNKDVISIHEAGESSTSSKSEPDTSIVAPFFMCEICVEDKPLNESFRIKGCSHSYCSDCIGKYVGSKVQDNITRISCPVSGCNGVLELEHCRSVLPPDVFDRWGDALCEALILASAKFYCPFKDCSALLIEDGDEIEESECPICRRLFCAKCKVPWHSGVVCGEFQNLHKDEREREDIMLMQLAKNNHWRRCPKCKFYVERTEGCSFMLCRCKYTFCYHCGVRLSSHYCSICKR